MASGARVSTYFRQTSALLLVMVVTFEAYRDWNYFQSDLGLWSVLLNFIYFQLPLKSRALAFLHSVAFTSAAVLPVAFLLHLYLYPSYLNMISELWETTLSWSILKVNDV